MIQIFQELIVSKFCIGLDGRSRFRFGFNRMNCISVMLDCLEKIIDICLSFENILEVLQEPPRRKFYNELPGNVYLSYFLKIATASTYKSISKEETLDKIFVKLAVVCHLSSSFLYVNPRQFQDDLFESNPPSPASSN